MFKLKSRWILKTREDEYNSFLVDESQESRLIIDEDYGKSHYPFKF
jgi:hypothetical protein